ncbi:MAG: ABC-F family ATP-binding cassette domain-containing protein, partial [Clostridia bacterium]|nr:ABC-F family ATP-binding cassette domain-containing protein [Clostridia bacterium]
RNALAKVGLKGELALNPLSELSGGEQVRLKLCVLMQKTTNLLVLDEPTNHLDVRAKDALKKALAAYPGGLILVTHEKPFAEGLCNIILDVKE